MSYNDRIIPNQEKQTKTLSVIFTIPQWHLHTFVGSFWFFLIRGLYFIIIITQWFISIQFK